MSVDANLINCLFLRETGVKSNFRCNLKVMTRLVRSEHMHFVKVWEKHCSKPIHYDSGRLYFDNYRSCFAISGHKGLPQCVYKLPVCSVSEKIEEALICSGPHNMTHVSMAHKGYRPSFLALTASNWLIRYDFDTGQVLQEVYLSHRHKFRHLAWDLDEYSVVLKSTHNKMSAISREAAISQTLLMSLAIFTVFPLEFVALLDVTKKIFGKDIRDAMLSQGVLIVMHQGDLVKLYSLDHILSMGQTHSPHLHDTVGPGDDRVGSFPTGLPLNINLNKCPPVLFQVKCSDHSLSLGGIPWHYIITPPGSRGFFKAYSLQDGQLADGGYLELESVSIEPDKCLFHPDDSGRIMHLGSKELYVHKLINQDGVTSGLPQYKIQEVYNIQPFSDKVIQGPEIPCYSSSGRVIKRSASYVQDIVDDSYENIQTVDYEDDLDLLYLSVVCQGQDGLEGKVHIHDNHTGKLVKEVPLQEQWKEFNDHVICLDLDTLVHIVKSPMRKFSCFVYRLQRPDPDLGSEPVKAPKRSSRQKAIGDSLLDDTVRQSSYRMRRRAQPDGWT